MSAVNWDLGLVWYIVFLFSTTLHEASHAFAAYRLGDRTAYDCGQVSLSPFPHIKREPFGMVLVPLLSFFLGGFIIGWASTHYDPVWALNHRGRAALMSLAGPLANFGLVLVSAFLLHAGFKSGFFLQPELVNFTHLAEPSTLGFPQAAVLVVSILFSLNLILGLFNLIPLPPLDGSALIPVFLGRNAALSYLKFISSPSFAFLGLFIAWSLFDRLIGPAFETALGFVYGASLAR